MTDNAKFDGSIPLLYDRHMGPVIFEPYADDLAQRVASMTLEGPVLETACGTGRLTKHLRAKLPNSAKLYATDLNQAMIDVARDRHREEFDVEWKQADAMALPFPDSMFSAVVNQFGMMFVQDKATAIGEAARVLNGGGLFAFSVWDNIAENPFGQTAERVILSFFSSDLPTFFQVPFGFHDTEVWIKLLNENGFTQISVQKVAFEARSESAEHFAIGLVRGGPISVAIQERNLPIDEIISALTQALILEGGDQPFRSRMQAFVITARSL